MSDSNEPWVPSKDPSPDARIVTDFHRRSDVDQTEKSQHHTLGTNRYNAARGDHIHDGSTGAPLLDDLTLSGDVSDPKDVPGLLSSLFEALATDLGAKDNTTKSNSVLAVETGTALITWTVAGAWSAGTTVPLTVGRFSTTPFIFLTRTAVNVGGGRACDYRVTSRSVNSFICDAVLGGGDTATIGTSLSVMWLAVGTKTIV